MKSFLIVIGTITVVLGILGSLGFGNFVFMYSQDKITCVKEPV